LDRSFFEREAWPADLESEEARSAAPLGLDFKSVRVRMIHDKLTAVPKIAIVASMAVKREAPNKIIATTRRGTSRYTRPYGTLCVVPPRSIFDSPQLRLDNKTSSAQFVATPMRQKFDQTQSCAWPAMLCPVEFLDRHPV